MVNGAPPVLLSRRDPRHRIVLTLDTGNFVPLERQVRLFLFWSNASRAIRVARIALACAADASLVAVY